ncbi:MAG TPA: hypothetical protein VMJ32_09795 [Pirellulales bacterium]|nr:hypothetical protein [Pirellulales bacterium]
MPRQQSLANHLLHPLERGARWATRTIRDALENRQQVTGNERILLVRHRLHITSYYRKFLDWVATELPDVRRYFELCTLPCRSRIDSRTRLVVPWVSENMVSRRPHVYRQLKELEAIANAGGIETINRVDRILQALKLEASEAIAAAGVRTPKMTRILDHRQFNRDFGGLHLPLLIRENRAHGGSTKSYLIRNRADVERVPLEKFEDPIAVEFINVQSPVDGYFRKYRYLAAGQRGIALSVQIAKEWEVRGTKRDLNAATCREEMEHQRQPDSNHQRFQQVRRILGLDVVAFDYSYTPTGDLVVWEINVLPGLGLEREPERQYINYAQRRAMAAIIELYLTRAGIEAPDSLSEIVATGWTPASPVRRSA